MTHILYFIIYVAYFRRGNIDKKRVADLRNKLNNNFANRQKALDYEYLKTRVYDLEQKTISLEKELKETKNAINIMWNSVQRLTVLKAETAILPDDLDETAPNTFIGTKPEE